ncbi:MAG: glycogen/starch/alpha-glucan phosphorylase, partial [Kiritimatiellia bacterium]|nr:glycogen/starch/alpha-glucan phosphorylase [Kiritimatiellia bacterium]
RRWLLQSNPLLSEAITRRIGNRWILDLDEIRKLEPWAEDATFRQEFLRIKLENKRRLAGLIRGLCNEVVDPASMFDVQVKRLHEYKRQLLNAMHILALYLRIKAHPEIDIVPRTFIFGAKAAPSYHVAKRIIKFINTMGRTVNRDPDVAGRLKVVFLPDYRVSLAETIIPAADLSEQISTAGMEASGTGNMKLALNGALTIGTWDGANIEIAEAVGLENIFIFGLRAEDVFRLRASGEYRPLERIAEDPELAAVLEAIRVSPFSPEQPDLFSEIHYALTEGGDYWMHLADFREYVRTQEQAAELFRDPDAWARKAILNVSRMGPFSSDRTIRQYATEVWDLKPTPIHLPNGNGR